MPNEQCFASLNLEAIRVSKIGSGGAPVVGATSALVTDAAVRLQVAVTLEAGTSFSQKNGAGRVCAALTQPDTIKALALSMDLCQLDMELLNLLTGATLFTDTGHTIGFQYPLANAAENPGVCLEAWTAAWDGTGAAVPTFTTPDAAFFHWVFPRVKWTMGQMTLENALMVVPVTGIASENHSITANGPFNDWPTAVATAGGVVAVGGAFFDDTLPTVACGRSAVPTQT